MGLSLLGPLQVTGDKGAVLLGGPKERAVLAMLGLDANRPVAESRLIDGLWGEEPPRTALKILQNLILRLRKAVAAEGVGLAIETTPSGYVLTTSGTVDMDEMAALRAGAKTATGRSETEQAMILLTRALGLWRGDALAEFEDFPFAGPEAARLSEMRKQMTEDLVEAELRLGHHDEWIGELEAMVAADPLREGLWKLRMMALYRAGRQADALAAYQELRTVLSTRLGLDPSSDLRALELAILTQDPALDWVSPRLPSGTVTFLFTELESSLRLHHDLGDGYGAMLLEQSRIVADSIRRNGGRELLAGGEAHLAAFADPIGAITAAADAQLALAAGDLRGSPKVKIGIHASETYPVGGAYLSLPPRKAERLASAASGGQVVLTQACADLVTHLLPPPMSLSALGRYHLRDFPTPEHLLQLCHPDLPSHFPPPNASAVVVHNLPLFRTSFVGRAVEQTQIPRLLEASGIVTIAGPGGVGKTRLAVETALACLDDYPDGAWMISLGSLTDPNLVPQAIASLFDVYPAPGRAPLDSVAETLRSRRALLLLDNCEHLLLAAAQAVETLARACPFLGILATSREPLRVDGEAIVRLSPLRVPVPSSHLSPQSIAAYDAVRLFVERAQLAQPEFSLLPSNSAAVARISAGVDGLPLAIELAAARLGDLTLTQIAEGLGRSLELLTMGRRAAEPRQRTIEATIAWSYDLLTDADKQVFRALSVFSGGFDLEAVAAVVGLDLDRAAKAVIDRLVNGSLIQPAGEHGTARFDLPQIVKEFAARELQEDASAHVVGLRHLEWFAAVVDAAHEHFESPDESAGMELLAHDHGNIRAALQFALIHGDPQRALGISSGMAPFWDLKGHLVEGRGWLDRALAKTSEASMAVRAEGLLAIAGLLAQFDTESSVRHAVEAVATFRTLGDRARLGRALSVLGYGSWTMGNPDEARRCLEEGILLLRLEGDQAGAALALGQLASLAFHAGETDRAVGLLEE
ncbi:MAG: hypothetical protein QOD63_901, partial [Actinomycetota bacterium]|nr:hypothetical protein [Actinomycetota bacterium]